MMTLRKLRAIKTIQRHGRNFIHMERLMEDINKSLERAKDNKLQGISTDITDDISNQPRDLYYDKRLKQEFMDVANKFWSQEVKRPREESSLKFSEVSKRWLPPTKISSYYIEGDLENGFKLKETELRDGTFTINNEFANFVVKALEAIREGPISLQQFIQKYQGGKFFSDLGPLFEEAITNIDKKGKHKIIQDKTPMTMNVSHKPFMNALYQKYLKHQLSVIA